MKTKDELQTLTESIVLDFSERLKVAACTGYSFFETRISKDGEGLIMHAKMGLKINIGGEEEYIGADIKFERGTNKSKPGDRANMFIDYEFSKGRDLKIQYYDERSNTPGNDKSINGIRTSDMLFNIIYNMTSPIYENSPMPMMG